MGTSGLPQVVIAIVTKFSRITIFTCSKLYVSLSSLNLSFLSAGDRSRIVEESDERAKLDWSCLPFWSPIWQPLALPLPFQLVPLPTVTCKHVPLLWKFYTPTYTHNSTS